MRVAPLPRHLAWPAWPRAAWGLGPVLVRVVGVLVRVLQVPALALCPRLGAVHGAPVLLPIAGHADSCRQPGGSVGRWGHGTEHPRPAALTVLTLLDAAALVPDVGVDSVTPRAPLVPVRVSAVILLQSIAGGRQEPAGSGVGRSTARSPSPQGQHSHSATPPPVGAIAPALSPLPPCCPPCPHAVPIAHTLSPLPPHCPQPVPHCPALPRATSGCCGAAGDTGTPVIMGCRGLPVLAVQALLCRGPRATVAGAVGHNAVPQVVWVEPGTASEPRGRARLGRMGSREPCAQSVVSPCPRMAPAHLSSGTGRSGCFSAAGRGASAGSRAAAGTAGSASHSGKPWETQRKPGTTPCGARARGTRGHTHGHPASKRTE